MHHTPAAGVSLNDKLRLAASKGQTSKVLELLELGANCDADRQGRTALHFAAHYGHSDTVAALILTGCDVNTPDFSGHTALQRASAEGHSTIVQQLIKHGAHVDHQDDIHGNTALHESAWKGYSQTIEVLCKAKANYYIKNKGGFAPLHLACQNGHNQSCRVLLISGCKPDIKNNYGDTPLHTSARYGHAGAIRILISANCNVSDQNKNDDTALHISSAMGRRKLTRILLESGCDQTLQNKQGEKAMDIAKRKDFGEVMEILKNPPPPRSVAIERQGQEDAKKVHKKRDKESGTSKDSKDSGSRHKGKHKNKKSKHAHGHKVHFKNGGKEYQGISSPYGCHHSSNMMSSFPGTNLDSLPKEPLKKGEQYYLDLAGNIRKGPIGVGYACYCVPFFQHVEQKMENDKQELMEHIDLAHDDLNAKISNLERRTRAQLFTINQGMKERLATDKAECLEKVERASTKDRIAMARAREQQSEQLKSELKTWVQLQMRDIRRRAATAAPRSSDEESEDSEEEDSEEEEEDPGFLRAFRRSGKSSGRSHRGADMSRSKSEEVISERGLRQAADDGAANLRVLGRRPGDFGRSHDERLFEAAADRDKENGTRAYGGRRGNWSPAPDKIGRIAESEVQYQNVAKPNGGENPSRPNSGGAGAVLHDSQDHDSGYTTKLHSSFDSQSSPRPPSVAAGGCRPLPLQQSLRQFVREFGVPGEPEFVVANRQFLDTVSHETDKWYERRMLSIERRAGEFGHHPGLAGEGVGYQEGSPRDVREVGERAGYVPSVRKPAMPLPLLDAKIGSNGGLVVGGGNTASLV